MKSQVSCFSSLFIQEENGTWMA